MGQEKVSDHLRECFTLLQTLAYVGHKDTDSHLAALNAGLRKIGVRPLKKLKKSKISFKELDKAIETLVMLRPKDKQKLLEGCIACMKYNKKINLYEAELFRAFGDSLGCPVPLILPD